MKIRINAPAFTIVELLIVIVVIAILAAISVVAYNGIQQRARDSQRKNDLSQIAKVFQTYNIDSGSYFCPGSGSSGNGNGWFNLDYDGATSTLTTMSQCLMNSGHLSKELIDPSGTRSCGTGTICRAYGKITCTAGVYAGSTFLFASLESEASGQDGPTNNTCQPTYDTDYGFNYTLRFN